MKTISITSDLTTWSEDGSKEIDGLDADRGVNFVVDDKHTTNPRFILSILFDGFDKRLREAGVTINDWTAYS